MHILYPKAAADYNDPLIQAFNLAGATLNEENVAKAGSALNKVDDIVDKHKGKAMQLEQARSAVTTAATAAQQLARVGYANPGQYDLHPIPIYTREPLVLKYMEAQKQSLARGKPFRNTLPWHALAEKLAVADWVKACKDLVIEDPSRPHATPRSLAPDALSRAIRSSVAYLWRTDMEKIAHSCPLPPHTIHRQALPHPEMFFSRETGNEDLTALDWFYVSDNNGTHCIAMTNIVEPDAPGGQRLYGVIMKYGGKYPDDFIPGAHDNSFNNVDSFNMVTMILQYLAFLNSDYTTLHVTTPAHDKGPDGIPHHTRKEYTRHKLPLPASPISVIKLRERKHDPSGATPPEGSPHRPVGNAEMGSRHYAYQFWVRGHIRNQACGPNRTLRTPKWIAPYVKGPENAPFKTRIYDVRQ